MKKKNIIKKNIDFNRIIKNKKPLKSKYFLIFTEKKEENIPKFGFSVGTKIGNAVTRNYLKRKIKSIIDQNNYKKNFNYIIMVKRSILNKKHEEIQKDLENVLFKYKMEEENEK